MKRPGPLLWLADWARREPILATLLALMGSTFTVVFWLVVLGFNSMRLVALVLMIGSGIAYSVGVVWGYARWWRQRSRVRSPIKPPAPPPNPV